MNVLLTSGGTSVEIDSVRAITNFSKGTLGKEIATELLLKNNKVTHLHSISSDNPFSFKVDLCKKHEDYATRLEELQWLSYNNMSRYKEELFFSYYDYEERIDSLLKNFKYDCVILCAAVSDYGVEQQNGKIDSKSSVDLKMFRLPKIINKIKGYQPETKLVGFKMLVGASNYELSMAAEKQFKEANSDLVIANNMPNGSTRTVLFCLNREKYQIDNEYSGSVKDIAKEIVRRVTGLVEGQK